MVVTFHRHRKPYLQNNNNNNNNNMWDSDINNNGEISDHQFFFE